MIYVCVLRVFDVCLGNLSPDTIFVQELDSGLAAMIDVHNPTEFPQFMAPELRSRRALDSLWTDESVRMMAHDMYSFGALLVQKKNHIK